MDQFWIYFKLGLTHVLDWNAYDHVLFLIVLVASYSFLEWKRVFWLVTTFTIGHTLALLLSTFNVLKVNTTYVEFLIPITIMVAAIYNIFIAGRTPKSGKNNILLFTTLFFGLIHGLGFSSFFLSTVSSDSDKLINLLEFALGIEAAQVIVVVAVMVLGFIFQSIFNFAKRDWVLVVSSIVVGLVLPILFANAIW